MWNPAVAAICGDSGYGTDCPMITNIADWLHVKSWAILCSLWRGSRAGLKNKRGAVLAREDSVKDFKVFKVLNKKPAGA